VALTLTKRMDLVEQKLVALEALPERMSALESQFVQLRSEIRAEFSAWCKEMRMGDEESVRLLSEDIRTGDEETRRVLREEIRTGDEETRKLMRILHEDVITRIATTQEGRNGRRTRKR
jgi:hypothetical protein